MATDHNFRVKNSLEVGGTVIVSSGGVSSSGNLVLRTSSTDRWEMTTAGHILPAIDNTYDIGSSSKKVRDIYVSDGSIKMGTDTVLSVNADGDFELKDASGNPKNLKIEELELGTGDNKVILKKGSDGRLESQEKVSGTKGTARKAFFIGIHNSGDISEGTNKFYTDARVASYLSSQGFATQSNVVASIVDSAPSTLDTLNELAAALGDDANFSTTVTNSIATKLPLAGGTLTGALNAGGGINGLTLSKGISGNNFNITGVNQLTINDPGEGIVFGGGSTTMSLAIVDDATDRILRYSGTGAVFDVQGNITLTGTVTATGGNSTNWNAAYTYSQVGHVKLDGTSIISGSSASNGTRTPMLWMRGKTGDSVNQINVRGADIEFGQGGTLDATPAFKFAHTGILTATGQINASGGNSAQWNTAYGWGNHASAGYLTSYTDTNTHTHLDRTDNRTISPNEYTAGHLNFGFTSWANNNTSPYADFIHMRSYTDSSGGSDNMVMFKKSGIGMRLWQQSWNSSNAYSSYVDFWHSGNDGSGSGLDADLLDGMDSTRFISGTGTTGTTVHTVSNWNSPTKSGWYSDNAASNKWSTPNWSSIMHVKLYDSNNSYASQLGFDTYNNNLYTRTNNNGTWTSWDKIWHAGVDGSGSGLDADLLDGQHGSYYYSPANPAPNQTITLSGHAVGSGTTSIPVTVEYVDSKLDALNVNLNNPPNFPASGSRGVVGFYNAYFPTGSGNISNYNAPLDGGQHYHMQQFNGYSANDGSWSYQIAHSFYNSGMFHRNQNNGTWQAWRTLWDSLNDGSGSGLDADLLDGQHGSYYAPATGGSYLPLAGGTMTGAITTNGHNIVVNSNTGMSTNGDWIKHTTSHGYIQFGPANTSHAHIYTDRSNFYFNVNTLYQNGNLIWGANNDGSGSGLDADLLDGQQGSYYYSPANPPPTYSKYLRSDVSDVYNGRVLEFGTAGNGTNTSGAFLSIEGNTDSSGEGSGRLFFREHNSSTAAADNYGMSLGYRGGSTSVTTARGNTWTGLTAIGNGEWGMWGHDGNQSGVLAMHGPRTGSYVDFNNAKIAGNQVWHAGNDGSGSGLDADLLDGKSHENFGATLATFSTTSGTGGRIRCTAPFNTNSGKMFQVTVSLYTSYQVRNYIVAGYMYSTSNQWYSATAIYSGAGTPDIKVGRDSSGKAYISIARGSYTGVRVHSMTRGYYTSVADTYDPWTITENDATENSLTPTTSTTWHSTNDGSGSGLDADLLDGQHASAFIQQNTGNLIDLFANQNGTNELRLDNNRQDLGNVPVSKVSGRNSGEVANMTFYRGGGGSSGFIRFQNKPTNAASLTDVFQVGDGGTVGYGVDILAGGLRIGGNEVINSSRVMTVPQIKFGDGNDGYFYSDTNGRTAFANGDFYIQDTVTNYYNYATHQYIGASSGDNIYFRSNVLSGTGWGINGAGMLTTRDHLLNAGYHLQRADHHSGHLEGSYNNVGANESKSNPIYSIGSAYNPSSTTLGNMYGIGFSYSNASFLSFSGGAGWGMYVASDGDARVWLNGSAGTIASTGQHYVGSNVVWNAGNDGSGTGLDADLLDGQHASAFAPIGGSTGRFITGGLYGTGHSSSTLPIWQYNAGNPGYGIAYTESSPDVLRFDVSGHLMSGTADLELRPDQLKVNGNTVYHVGNDGSGTGLDADLLDGQHGSYYAPASHVHSYMPTSFLDSAKITFTVGGDADTYYPVSIQGGGSFAFQMYSISRSYSATAPNTWYTSTHKGGLTLTWQYSGDGFWGGNDHDIRIIKFDEIYSTMVMGMAGSVGGGGTNAGVVVWLRGGTASYTFHGPRGSVGDVNVHLTSVTASNGTVFAPRSFNASTRDGEINPKYPIRNSSVLYDNNNRVWSAGNDGSGSGLDADLLDGLHASDFARLDGTNHARTYPNRWFATADANNNIDFYDQNHAKVHMGVTGKYTTSRAAITSDQNYWVGSMGWGQTDLNTIMSYGSGFWDAWSTPANRPSTVTTHWTGLNAMHYAQNNSYMHGMQMAMGAGNPSHTYLRGWWANGGSGYGWQKIWTDGNDGSGSGLDADTVDGVHASSFLTAETDTLASVTGRGASTSTEIDFNNDIHVRNVVSDNNYGEGMFGVYASTRHQHVWSMGEAYKLNASGTSVGNLYGLSYTHTNVGTGYGANSAAGLGHQLNGRANGTLQWALGDGAYFTGAVKRSGHTMWDAGNDGSGSGLDADLLDGQNSDYYWNKGSTGLEGTNRISSISNFNNSVPSGFYEASSASNMPGSSWHNMLNVRHSNTANDHGFQLSMSYYNNNLFSRSYQGGTGSNNGSYATWAKQWSAENDGSGSGLDADLLDGRHLSQVARFQSSSDFANGTLVTTDINSSGTSGDSFVIEVTGKAYGGSRPHSIIAEGYLYYDTIINTNGTNISGSNFTYLKVMNISGNLCFWWPRHSYWNSYDVHVRSSSGGTANYNRVTAIANSTDPSSATKKIQINLATSWNSSNDGSGSGLDADTLDGQHGSYYAPASSIPSVGNGTLTIAAGTNLTGGGTFTANQSGNTTITLNASGGGSGGSQTIQQVLDTGDTVSTNQKINFRDSGKYIISETSSTFGLFSDAQIRLTCLGAYSSTNSLIKLEARRIRTNWNGSRNHDHGVSSSQIANADSRVAMNVTDGETVGLGVDSQGYICADTYEMSITVTRQQIATGFGGSGSVIIPAISGKIVIVQDVMWINKATATENNKDKFVQLEVRQQNPVAGYGNHTVAILTDVQWRNIQCNGTQIWARDVPVGGGRSYEVNQATSLHLQTAATQLPSTFTSLTVLVRYKIFDPSMYN